MNSSMVQTARMSPMSLHSDAKALPHENRKPELLELSVEDQVNQAASGGALSAWLTTSARSHFAIVTNIHMIDSITSGLFS